MKAKAVLGTRLLLGIIFLVFGSNGLMFFLTGNGFIPMPPPSPEMGAVMAGFVATKYLMPLVKLLQIVSGIFLLSNCFVNLALIFLAPIVVNILGIHLFVDPAGLPMAVVLCALVGFQIASRWQVFKPLTSK